MNKTDREAAGKSLEKRSYIMKGLLGQGAFSEVYFVEEMRTGRQAACKISGNMAMLRREAEILDQLNHPLFPEIYEIWSEGNQGFLLMERVPGKNLAECLRQGGRFSARQIAELGMELAEGLLYLHERQTPILFRDVKPENIMLRADGRIKLLDFGCACALGQEAGSRAGTPGYGAPEQFEEGGEQTPLCDVYGLGKTLQALFGALEPRKEGQSPGERLWERRDQKRLERLLAACVEETPSARPADMRVVMAALFPLCAGGTGGKSRGSWGGDFWQQGIVCEKNIWKSGWKTS